MIISHPPDAPDIITDWPCGLAVSLWINLLCLVIVNTR